MKKRNRKMENEDNDKDREMVSALQEGFPLVNRPFLELANRLGMTEEEVISRLKGLQDQGKIRKFGAVISPKKMGFVSLLAAIDVPDEKIDTIAKVINSYEGVTHNYVREGKPNIWFTLTEPDQATLDANLAEIENSIGARILRLPMTKLFKIGVKLDI
jgi:DNA-binding Lrp family transcriptional regulator